jgi:hypothetical protein
MHFTDRRLHLHVCSLHGRSLYCANVMARRVTILYKNAARIGTYAACQLQLLGGGEVVEARAAVETYRAFDCLRPPLTGAPYCDTDAVIACNMHVYVCDALGEPCTEAAAHVAPDILIRTDRGPWSAFHGQSVVLLPAPAPGAGAGAGAASESSVRRETPLSLQVATKERSNVMRAVLCVAFRCARTGTLVARSEPLLVLSKPPAGMRHPFSRVLPLDEAGPDAVPLDTTSRCSPSKWLDHVRGDTHAMVALSPAVAPVCWRVCALGTYRSAPAGLMQPSSASPVTREAVSRTSEGLDAESSEGASTGYKRRLDGSDVANHHYEPKKPRVEAASTLAVVGGEADRADDLERELALMRQQLVEERARREAAEAEKAGLARALRLLAKRAVPTTTT